MPALEKCPANDRKGGLTGPWLENVERLLTAPRSRTSWNDLGIRSFGGSGLIPVVRG
jgi:hypothetical protein